jgi:DNA-binding beta-propeller fold protein YncE
MTCRAVLPRPALRRPLALTVALALLGAPIAPAQTNPPCGNVPVAPPVENRDGYFVNLEEAPLHPLEFGSDGLLWATNLPDARIVAFSLANPLAPQAVADVAVGLGPVAIRLRPGSAPRELWVACQSSNAVFVIDEAKRRVKDVVRLMAEPTSIDFDSTGEFGYVTLAAANQIAKIHGSTATQPTIQPSNIEFIEFQSEMPLGSGRAVHAEEPRALRVEGNDVYVLSYLSGNGSVADTFDLEDPEILDGWQLPLFGLPAPPDRDVLRFDAANPLATGDAVLWRLGTLNFDLERGGPSNHLYVSTVDFRNFTADAVAPKDNVIEGEFDYLAKGFGTHAVAHAAPTTGTPQGAAATTVVDLNDPARHDPALPADFRCAVPNDMALQASTGRLFVACYETRNAAVLDLATDTVIAELRADTASPDGFGPRGIALHPDGKAAYLYDRGDQRLQVFDLTGLGPGSLKQPVPVTGAVKVGFDITSVPVLNGRRHFLSSSNSASGLSTCNTCHMDGHLDGIAWDLSDFTGKLDQEPVERVAKGVKVTMSLRGIEETPPFHWRGDRADLANFNPAFQGLLGGQQLTEPQMREFEAFVFSLSYPANPNLANDRIYSDDAQRGFDCFANFQTMHKVKKDTSGTPAGNIDVSCADCHSMAGGSGTLNQVNNPLLGLLADDATQLRGLWDKQSDLVKYTGTGLVFPLDVLPATGWGFANTSLTDSIQDFVDLNVFTAPPAQKVQVTKFLTEFDTGLAPATAFAFLVTGTPAPEETLLTGQADLGNCDLVVRGWIRTPAGTDVPIGMQWDTASQKFQTDTTALGPYTLGDLQAKTLAGEGAFALIGTPVKSGYRLGRDRDMDFRLDGDEALAPATSVNSPDSDRDGFPDGYETRLGSDPTSAASTPVDTVKPQIPTGAVAWKNSNVMKVRWTTDEESTSRLQVYRMDPVTFGLQSQSRSLVTQQPTQPVQTGVLVFDREDTQFKKQHVMVARGLKPELTYRAIVLAKDPSGNTSRRALPDEIMQDHKFDSVHVTLTTLQHTGTNANGTHNYTASFTVVKENGQPLAGAKVKSSLVEWTTAACPPGFTAGTCSVVTVPPETAPSNSSGVATVSFSGTKVFSIGTAEVFVTAVDDPTSHRLYFKPLDGQFGFWAQAAVP